VKYPLSRFPKGTSCGKATLNSEKIQSSPFQEELGLVSQQHSQSKMAAEEVIGNGVKVNYFIQNSPFSKLIAGRSMVNV